VHRFFLLVLSWDFPGGRAYFILPRIGRTYPGPPPEVEGLMKTKRNDSGKAVPGEGITQDRAGTGDR